MLKAAEQRYDYIHVITQKNQYAGVARNNGLKIADGEYVIFLDPDDFFEYNLIEKMYNSAKFEGADLCVCGVNKYNEETQVEELARNFLRVDVLPGSPMLVEKIKDRIYNAFTFHSFNKLIRKSLLDNDESLRYKPYYVSEDTWFNAMLLASVKIISYIDEPLVHHRVNTGISLGNQINEHMFVSNKAYSEVWEHLNKQGFPNEIKVSFANKSLKTSIDMMRKLKSFEAYNLYYNRMVFEGGFSSQGITTEWINGCAILPERYYRTYHAMMEGRSAEEFLYSDYVRLENRTKNLSKRLKKSEETLMKTRAKLKIAKHKLKQTCSELRKIKDSRSYKFVREIRKIIR